MTSGAYWITCAWFLLPRKSLRAAYANSLKGMPIMPSLALDQPEGSLDHRALLRDALTGLDQLPFAVLSFGNNHWTAPPWNNWKLASARR